MEIDRAYFDSFWNEVRAGFSNIGERLDRVEARLDRVEARLDKLEQRQSDSEGRTSRLEQGMFELLDRMERIEDGLAAFRTETFQGFQAMDKVLNKNGLSIIDLQERVTRLEGGSRPAEGGEDFLVNESAANYADWIKADREDFRRFLDRFLKGEPSSPMSEEEVQLAKETAIRRTAQSLDDEPVDDSQLPEEILASREKFRHFCLQHGQPEPSYDPRIVRKNSVEFLENFLRNISIPRALATNRKQTR